MRAVPVLPATQNPGIWACVPVPTSTAYARSWVSVVAVAADTTRCSAGAGAGWYTPDGSIVPRTSDGCTRTPPLAIVAYTQAICSGVTATPCPIVIVGRLVPDHSPAGGRMPLDSPGNPTPVTDPRPNAWRYPLSRPGLRRSSAIWIIPMLLE